MSTGPIPDHLFFAKICNKPGATVTHLCSQQMHSTFSQRGKNMKSKKTLLNTLLAVALVTMAVITPLSATAAENTLVSQTVVSGSVKDVVSTLSKMVAKNGMMIMGELHQGKVLEMTGLKVESESIFVGSPTMGKKLFSANPGVGQVVPVRINIFKGADGKTVVSYIPPSKILSDYNDPMLTKMANMLDGNLAKMTGMLN